MFITNFDYNLGFLYQELNLSVLVFEFSRIGYCKSSANYVPFHSFGMRFDLMLIGLDSKNNIIYQKRLRKNEFLKVPCEVKYLFEVPMLL